MTRKEKILEILQKHIFADGDIWVIYDLKKMYDDLLPILALDLDVPSDEEIAKKIQLFRKNKLDGYGNMSIGRLQLGELEWSNLVLDISKWMRDEIIKRNTKK